MKKKISKKVKSIIVCGITSILLIVGIIVFVLSFRTIEIRNIATYNRDNYLKTKDFKSNFLAFPLLLNNVEKINNYYYIDYQLRDGCIIVLDATYDEITFDNEIKRLNDLLVMNWKQTDEQPSDYGKYKSLLYCDDGVLFTCPTYIAQYNFLGQYEYVCIDYAEKRFIYVYIDSLSCERIPLDSEYLPVNYEINNKARINKTNNSDKYRYTIYPLSQDVSYEEWYK